MNGNYSIQNGTIKHPITGFFAESMPPDSSWTDHNSASFGYDVGIQNLNTNCTGGLGKPFDLLTMSTNGQSTSAEFGINYTAKNCTQHSMSSISTIGRSTFGEYGINNTASDEFGINYTTEERTGSSKSSMRVETNVTDHHCSNVSKNFLFKKALRQNHSDFSRSEFLNSIIVFL
jgi:hypothetical protein